MINNLRSVCRILLAASLVMYLGNCKRAFEPPAIRAGNDYLVVDGFINVAPGSVTTIDLNRARRLSDSTAVGIPELNAQVAIQSKGGTNWPLQDAGHTGFYVSQPLTLDISQTYRLAVTTADGRKYLSDLVPCKPTPLIDSITWSQPGDLIFSISTHDASAKTRYYRWEYIETWQHDAALQTAWGEKNGHIFATDSTTQRSHCWTVLHSTDAVLDNTTALGQDFVDKFPIHTIPFGDSRLDIKYRIHVRQFALTSDAYAYWLQIQKTSQGLGTLFDLQPAQLIGNIHCLTNPGEPVIGYVSASTVQEDSLFLYNTNLHYWTHNSPGFGCDTLGIPADPNDFSNYTYPDTNWAPYYFNGPSTLILASKICLDCLELGGTTTRPPNWP
jgi:hypothetical protein